MLTIVQIAQLTGTISIFILFCLQFYIATDLKTFKRVGRVAILWTAVYVFFLFFIRMLSFLQVGDLDELRIISGFTSLIPLFAVATHLYLKRKAGINEPYQL